MVKVISCFPTNADTDSLEIKLKQCKTILQAAHELMQQEQRQLAVSTYLAVHELTLKIELELITRQHHSIEEYHHEQTEILERTMWEQQPLILSAKAAYELTPRNHHFYMVTWWGDNPTSLSQFEFTGVISAAYTIRITDEQGEPIKTLLPDEWVVVFQLGL